MVRNTPNYGFDTPLSFIVSSRLESYVVKRHKMCQDMREMNLEIYLCAKNLQYAHLMIWYIYIEGYLVCSVMYG